jgi:protein TonB
MPNCAGLHTPGFPSLLGDGYGQFQTRSRSFMLGFLAESIGVAALVAIAAYFGQNPRLGPRLSGAIANLSPISYPFSSDKSGGHGGGGDRDKLAASRGALPKLTLDDQLTPPEAVLRNLDPKLPELPSLMALSAVRLPQLGQLGDPLTGVQGPPSNGSGRDGGIGDACCGGVGTGNGPGFGPYDHGNVFWPGKGGVTAPRPIYDPDPEYSDAARKAKFQGSVLLWLVVGPNGRPRDIRVPRSLGMGLDEKALAAISQWRFQPATLNGQPVAVQINVEVSFRLY